MESDKNIDKVPLWHRLPMTRIRLFFAKFLYMLFKVVLRNDRQVITRNNIVFDVDLAEGIDFSLYVFGNYQDHITNNKFFSIDLNAVILDVGANIGNMALRFAAVAERGHVYAFEPSHFAYAKLIRNISLNPTLAERMTVVQAFVSSDYRKETEHVAYASWRIDGGARGAHPLHGGTLQDVNEVPALTVDEYCQATKLNRIDLIKIDTDGYELEVLEGALKTLTTFKPAIVFEAGLYIMKEKQIRFEQYFDLLEPLGYKLFNMNGGRRVTMESYMREIPLRFTTDLVALHMAERDSTQSVQSL